jgi:hypothetical protein
MSSQEQGVKFVEEGGAHSAIPPARKKKARRPRASNTILKTGNWDLKIQIPQAILSIRMNMKMKKAAQRAVHLPPRPNLSQSENLKPSHQVGTARKNHGLGARWQAHL